MFEDKVKEENNEPNLSFDEIDEGNILEIEPNIKTQSLQIPEASQSRSALDEQAEKSSLFARHLHKQNYENAVQSVFEFLSLNFNLTQLAWLKNSNRALQFFSAVGDWAHLPEQISLRVDHEKLKAAFENQSSLKLARKTNESTQFVQLFPLAIEGEEINAAIVVGDTIENNIALRERLVAFCRQIALPIEFINLREEVKKRVRLQSAVRKFNAELETIETENYLETLVINAAELVDAERCSLLIFDESEQSLQAAVAVGSHAEEIRNEKEGLGNRVASRVWREARPILVTDINVTDFPAAPEEYRYQTDSFISLPLKIGGRNVGVLNITEKRGESPFDKNDLLILETIAPQLAFALDRTVLSQKAGEYEIASITDSLTNLLNRRYLEERLAEELRRSARHGYPMSFMMIDVDNFKRYNDAFGHQAGDEALQITASCLRAALRSADVAARYGGDEFSILLPQTTVNEARLIAERIRRRVESTKFPHDRVTVSIGVAAYSPQYDSPQAVIEAADRALYDAKNSGRNNVRLF